MIAQLRLTDSFISSVGDASPNVYPVTLDYAKLHIRSLGSTDDLLVLNAIRAAASYFEEQTGAILLTNTREAWLDAFPFMGASGAYARIQLPKWPLQNVSTVKYIDADGTLQSFVTTGSPVTNLFTTSKPVGPYAGRGFVEPLYGGYWPIARAETGSVRIRYTCGYGDTMDDIPTLVRGILCFLIGHFDTFRSAGVERAVSELPFGVTAMLGGFKYAGLPTQVLRPYGTTGNYGMTGAYPVAGIFP